MGLSTTVLGSAAAVVIVLDGASGFLAIPSGRGESTSFVWVLNHSRYRSSSSWQLGRP